MELRGHLLIDDGSGRCILQPGMVRISEGRFEKVAFDDGPVEANRIIAPGFIDAHVHLPQFPIIGAHGMPLLEWLDQVVFKTEAKWADADHASLVAGEAIDQLIAHGTTSIAAYATVHAEGTRRALRVAGDRGISGCIGQVLMDQNAPEPLLRPADQLLDETTSLLDEFAEAPVTAAVTPRFAITCSEALMRGAGELSNRAGVIMQTHLAETLTECAAVGELFGGRRYVDVYADVGLVGPRSVFGHGIHLDGCDRSRLAATGAVIAHCPTANSFLMSGTMDRARLLSDRVKLAIGSDVGAGYERSMVRVGRAMIEAAATLRGDIPSASNAWHAITAGNADALGWSNVGRIREGSIAHCVVIEPTIAWNDSPVDPLGRLMFAWDDRWINEVYVRGRRKFCGRG